MPVRHSAAALALSLLGLSACAVPPQVASGPKRALYATDLAGKAPTCTTTPVAIEDGKDVATTMTTSGGGWCGVPVRRSDDPLGAGLLTEAPKNGSVYVHTVGDDTRVDYTPRAGSNAADSFAVKFIPGDATMRVTVTRTATAAAMPAAAPPPPEPAPAPSPTRTRTPPRARTTTQHTGTTK